jgi:outer membrane protein TolC
MTKHKLLSLLILIFFTLVVQGLIAQTTRTLTLEETLRIADEQSIDIRQARAALLRSVAAIDQARVSSLPELSASANYFYNIQRQILFVAPDVPFNETGTTQAFPIGSRVATSASLNFTQPILNPVVSARVRSAEMNTEVAKAQLALARRLVRMNAEKAFYRALYARTDEQTRGQQIQEAMKNLDITIARWKGGRVMPLDTLTAAAALSRARSEAETSRYQYLAAKLALARLLDIPDYQNLDVSGTLNLPLPPGPSGGEMINPQGRISSIEAGVAEARRVAVEAEIDVHESTARPSLNAVANASVLGQSDDINPAEYKWAMTSQVGLTFYYPLFNGWKNDPLVEDARLRMEEVKLEIERIRKRDSAQVEDLLLALQGARARIRAEEASLEQARKALEIAKILYNEGRATQLEVESAQSRLADVQLAIERIKLEFLESYAELKALVKEE